MKRGSVRQTLHFHCEETFDTLEETSERAAGSETPAADWMTRQEVSGRTHGGVTESGWSCSGVLCVRAFF